MAVKPSEFIKQITAARGKQVLEDRPPLAFAVRLLPGHDATKSSTLHVPSALVYPVVDPVLDALLMRDGATRRGAMSYQFGLGEDSPTEGIARMLRHAYPGTILPEQWAYTTKGPKPLEDAYYARWQWTRQLGWRRDHIGNMFEEAAGRHTAAGNPYVNPHTPEHVSAGLITYGLHHHSIWFKVFTNDLTLPDELLEEIGEFDVNLRPAGRTRRDPKPVRPAVAVAVAEWAADLGFMLVDPDGDNALAHMRSRLARTVVAWTRPGRPAQAQVSIGSRVELPSGVKMAKTGARLAGKESASRIGFCDAKDLAWLQDAGVAVVMPDSVADAARLASSEPVDDPRLRPFQRVAVGRHISTKVGYANLCSPGAGKSVMSLDGMRRRAAGIRGYRGLIIAEANVRKQFSREAATWFPEARVITVEGSKDAAKLAEGLRTTGDFPLIVFTSYALATTISAMLSEEKAVTDTITELLGGRETADLDTAEAVEIVADAVATAKKPSKTADAAADSSQSSLFEITDDGGIEVAEEAEPDREPTLAELLMSVRWHDLIADEAACLRNASSKQAKALWALRDNSDVAVALTGTPVSKSIDDLGRIIAWVRNDRHMFDGVRLENTFDLSTAEGLTDFASAIGPVLVRYDKSEFSDELPETKEPIVMELEPSVAELRLAQAARDELKRVYQELVTWMEQVEAANPDDPQFREAREALQAARGAWLGGTTLARMASSDPASLLGSSSAGAALLASQGLVQAATAQPGTKRTAVVNLCVGKVAEGERILIFTEFSSVATGLIADLRAAGLRVGEILGGGGRKRDEHVDAFRRGELDVMVATSAGERGLNLQTATMLVHYDLPWTPEGVIQRTGRVERIGATAASIQIVFPIMKGTIEERVASLVMARAAAASRALDATRGVEIRNTEVGRALGGLAAAVDGSHLSGREAALLEATREMLAA